MNLIDDPSPTIGLEIHCQLATDTRLFSPAPTGGEATNDACLPYDMGHPGTLPVLNQRAVDLAIQAGLALDCTVHRTSYFDRKHYAYPDLPRGFQITQQHQPICTQGTLSYLHDGQRQTLSIERLHLEEDAARSIHQPGRTLIDHNRAGHPLIEIVTAPELTSPEEAESALRSLHRLLVSLGVTDGELQSGSFRCDANISLSLYEPAPRTELKNLNSFRFVRKALAHELQRHLDAHKTGERFPDQTRRYDPAEDRTLPLRDKESTPEYRYLRALDLGPLELTDEHIQSLQRRLPPRPLDRWQRYTEDLHLDADAAHMLCFPPSRAQFFDAALDQVDPALAPALATLITNDLLSYVDDHRPSIADLPATAEDLARLAELRADRTINSSAVTTILDAIIDDGRSLGVDAIVDEYDLRQLQDPSALQAILDDVLAQHPDLVDDYRRGQHQLFGYFMGQAMKASGGRADPQMVSSLLKELLHDDPH